MKSPRKSRVPILPRKTKPTAFQGSSPRFFSLSFLSLLVLFLISGCSDNPAGKGPKDFLFAYGNGDGLYLIRGDGTLKQQVIGGAYYQPALSPDKTKVACVYDKDFQVTVFTLDENYGSHLKPKTIHNAQALSQGSKMTSVACPVWSADGQKIFFLNLNHLIVYDYQEQKTTSLFDFPDSQSAGQTPDSGRMALSRDGGTLYVMLSEGQGKLAFWTASTGSGQASPSATVSRDQLSTFKFPAEMSGDLIENLFGSRENPVLGPISSTDHRYYFYFEKGTGLLAQNKVKGYDRTTKETFEVAVLGTSLNIP